MSYFTTLSLFTLFGSLALSAAEVKVPLSGIPARVQQQNPDLAAARFRIDEAKGRLLGSGRLSNPEIGLSFKSDSRFREGAIGVSIDQQFPVTSRLRLEKVLSQKLVRAAELEVSNAARQTIAEAQALGVKLLALEQQRTLRIQQRELAEKLSKFASDRSAKGEISPLDAAQAQVDSQRLILESRKLENERITLLGELKPKLGIAAKDKLVLTGALPSVAVPAKAAWQSRPDYRLAQIQQDAALTEIDLAKSKKWGDLSAGVLWEGERAEDAPDGLERTGFAGVQLSIPLPFWNKNEGEIAEKAAAAQRHALETRALGALIANEAQAAREEMTAYASLAADTREKLLPLVLEQTNRLEKAYEEGQADLITLLRAREQRLQLESAVIESTRDYHLARVRYEAATGKHTPAANPTTTTTK